MKRLSLLVTAALVLLFCSVAVGEYYEYTDKEGVVRYTDDPSMIPEDQQPNVKAYESITSEPQEAMTEEETTGDMEAAEEAETKTDMDMDTDTGTAKASTNENTQKEDELSDMRSELRQEFDALQAEKNALGPPPSLTARTRIRKEYNDKVMELNRKIDDYDKRNKEFNEKVKAFNSQIGK